MTKSCKLKYPSRWFVCFRLIIMVPIDEFSESIDIWSDRLSGSVVISEPFNNIEGDHKRVDCVIEENRFHDELSEAIFFSHHILELLNE
jgi:hypothetical protein